MKILIADSDASFASALTDACSRIGQTETAGDGVEAIRKIKRFRPDVVLVDLLLSVIDGSDVIAQTYEKRPLFLVNTALEREYARDEARQVGVQTVLGKTTDLGVICRAIDSAKKCGCRTLSTFSYTRDEKLIIQELESVI